MEGQGRAGCKSEWPGRRTWQAADAEPSGSTSMRPRLETAEAKFDLSKKVGPPPVPQGTSRYDVGASLWRVGASDGGAAV